MADLSLPSVSEKDILVFSRYGFFTDKQMLLPLTLAYPFHLSCIPRAAHINFRRRDIPDCPRLRDSS